MGEKLLAAIIDSPLEYAGAICIVSISVAIFIRIAGSPLDKIIDFFQKIIPAAFKELRGKAGPAGVVNIIITICTFLLAFTLYVTPDFFKLWGLEKVGVFIPLIVFGISVLVFIISLDRVSESDKFKDLYKE